MRSHSSVLISALGMAAMFLPASAKTKVKQHPTAVRPAPVHAIGVHPKGVHPTAVHPQAVRGTPVHPKADHGPVRHLKKRGKAARPKVTSRAAPRQANPSSDRYREIQEALAAKGYLKTPPTGVWDQDSVEAMKRFQEDQKITSTGKLNSLSLIALGLGPKDRTPETPEK
jgi:peptidoglycan hydrolase-like protein with peptidoglycan-binding domain